MIDHKQIPHRYNGWERIDRENGITHYWNNKNKQSIFFGATNEFGPIMDCFAAGRDMLSIHPGRSWAEFEQNCKICHIDLDIKCCRCDNISP